MSMTRTTCLHGHDLTLPNALTTQGQCRVCHRISYDRWAATPRGRERRRAAQRAYQQRKNREALP